jgi:hypothetical protein
MPEIDIEVTVLLSEGFVIDHYHEIIDVYWRICAMPSAKKSYGVYHKVGQYVRDRKRVHLFAHVVELELTEATIKMAVNHGLEYAEFYR